MQTLQATTLIAILLVASSVWADLKLVDNGKTHTVIIIPEDASFVTDSAARQIQRYLKKISGGDVAIHIENSFSFEPDYYWIGPAFSVISIGQTKLAADAGLSVAQLAPEGFTIQTKGNVLFILGSEDRTDTTQLRSTKWNSVHWPLRQRGTLFGVYTFLEDYLGVRWLWPGDLGEVVPKQQDVVIGEIDRIGSPAMAYRIVHPPHIAGAFRTGSHNLDESHASHLQRAYDADVWVERQKLGRSLIIDQTHAYGDAFWNKYHVDHPEWFAVQPDGKRMSKQRLAGRVRLCHSNRQLQEEVARIVLDKLAKNPDVWSVGVGLDDTSPETFCKCDECKAFGPTLTDRVVRFDSAIAELVARKHPDKRISMFAYAEWRDAPIEAKLHPNVVVVYVGVYTHGYLYASDRQENHALWNNWSKIIEGKMLWRPNMPESLGIPIVYAHQWAEDLQRFAPKAWGVDVDGLRGSWASAGLTQYVMAKLLWNPDQQVDAIIEDYCQAGFGPAANPIGQYFAALEQYTSEAAKQAPAAGYHKFCPWAPTFYTSQRLAKLQSLLDQGRQLAADDRVVVKRIEFLQVGLDWTKMALKAWAIYAADGDRDQARPLVGELYGYLRKHRESYAIYSGYLEAKIGWMWKEFFGEEAKENWSRTF